MESPKYNIQYLLVCLMENNLDDEQREYLLNWSLTDPDAVQEYCAFMRDYAIVDKHFSAGIQLEYGLSDDTQFDQALWNALQEEENTAPAIELQAEKTQRELIKKVVYPPREKQRASKLQIFTLAASAAVILFFVYLYFTPQKPSSVDVATIIDQINVQWGQTNAALNSGDRLFTNAGPLYLKKGAVKIHCDQGVDVVVEGPATFELERSGIYLEYGRLYSRVSESGRGFRVETPTSQFIDLGTEFGVQADVNGSSELHVIKGKVQFFAGSKGLTCYSQMITEQNAMQYDVNRDVAIAIPIQKYAFVREVNSAVNNIWKGKNLNLADVVGGGNGFGTGQINMGINHKGQSVVLDRSTSIWGESAFTSETSNPFVDSVFIPNGRMQIDSEGTIFYDFDITNGAYSMGVLNGAWHRSFNADVPRHQLRLQGIEYGTKEHPAIYMHANQGVTFDLEAIRQSTQLKIARFRALCGISETVADFLGTNPDIASRENLVATFKVLIDGREKFSRHDITYKESPEKIDIELSPQDRYLTLITTQGSVGDHVSDWTLFAEPVLVLEP